MRNDMLSKILNSKNVQSLNNPTEEQLNSMQRAVIELFCSKDIVGKTRRIDTSWIPETAFRNYYGQPCHPINNLSLFAKATLGEGMIFTSYIQLHSHVHNIRETESAIQLAGSRFSTVRLFGKREPEWPKRQKIEIDFEPATDIPQTFQGNDLQFQYLQRVDLKGVKGRLRGGVAHYRSATDEDLLLPVRLNAYSHSPGTAPYYILEPGLPDGPRDPTP